MVAPDDSYDGWPWVSKKDLARYCALSVQRIDQIREDLEHQFERREGNKLRFHAPNWCIARERIRSWPGRTDADRIEDLSAKIGQLEEQKQVNTSALRKAMPQMCLQCRELTEQAMRAWESMPESSEINDDHIYSASADELVQR